MTWWEEQQEKWNDFTSVVITLFLDALLVLVAASLTEGVKLALERIVFRTQLEHCDNATIIAVFYVSKFLILASFVLYVAFDVFSHLMNIIRKGRQKQRAMDESA